MKRNEWKLLLKQAMKGGAAAMVMIGVGVLILSYLLSQDSVKEEPMRYFLTALILISAGVGSIVTTCGISAGKMAVAGIYSAALMSLLLAVNILFFGRGIEGFWVTLLVVVGASFGAVIPSITPKRTKRIKGFKF